MNVRLSRIASLFALVLIVSSCSEKRPEHFEQSQGINLDPVSAYQGKTFDLETRDAIGKTPAEGDLKVEANIPGVNLFPIVSYTTSAKLLGDTPFVGRPHTHYEIRYELKDNKRLLVSKVAKKEDLPFQDYPFATQLADGRLSVPLLTYDVRYFRVDYKKTDQDEPTTTLIEMPEELLDRASHVRVDLASKKISEPIAQANIFPRSLFDGEWYYSATIVDVPDQEKLSVGTSFGIGVDTGLTVATKVYFFKSASTLQGFNRSIDPSLDPGNPVNAKSVIDIPVEWEDYQLSQDGNLRREKSTQCIGADCRYMRIKWTDLTTYRVKESLKNVRVIEDGGRGSNRKLEDVSLAPGYISFTLFDPTRNERIRYAFLKAEKRNYEPRSYPKEDRKKFGYFTVVKPKLKTADVYRPADVESLVLLNRYNPKAGEIVYHFTESSPGGKENQWAREAIRNAVSSWNEAFSRAQVKLRIRLDESFDVALGDIRYNAINLIDAVASNPAAGMGPKVADPTTGEQISATANIHLATIREGLIRYLRKYITIKRGEYDEYLLTASGGAFGGDFAAGELGVANSFANTALFGSSENQRIDLSLNKNIKSAVDYSKLYSRQKEIEFEAIRKVQNAGLPATESPLVMAQALSAYPATTGGMARLVQKQCPEIAAYISTLKEDQEIETQEEYPILLKCVAKIGAPLVQSISVHEIGHNLGFRHNFKASTDNAEGHENFYNLKELKEMYHASFGGTVEDDEILPDTSSIMEYQDNNSTPLLVPGLADIATLAYGYGDSIMLEDKSYKPINPNLSITQNLKNDPAKIREFQFCTDEDSMLGIDPMCSPRDSGTTPLQIVQNRIKGFWADYQGMYFLRDRANAPNPMSANMIMFKDHIIPLKGFYDRWRQELRNAVGTENQYLEYFDPQAFTEKLSKMENDHKLYRPAAEAVYEFAKTLFQLPNQYCLTKSDKTGEINARELFKIRHAISSPGIKIKSCNDPLVAKYLATLDESETPVKSRKTGKALEIGYSVKNDWFNVDSNRILEPYDQLGTGVLKIFGMQLATIRLAGNPLNLADNFFPNMLDEPSWKHEIESYILDRSIVGANLQGTLKNIARFDEEAPIVANQFLAFKIGLIVPGKPTVSDNRLNPYWLDVTTLDLKINQVLSQGGRVLPTTGGRALIAYRENNKTIKIMDAYMRVKNLQHPLTEKTFAPLHQVIQSLPKKGDKFKIADYFVLGQRLVQLYKNQDLPFSLMKNSLGKAVEKFQNFLDHANLIMTKKNILSQKEAEEFTNQDMAQLLTRETGEIEDFPIDREWLQTAVNKEISEQAPKYKEKYDRYLKNREDYDAQDNLLRTMLEMGRGSAAFSKNAQQSSEESEELGLPTESDYSWMPSVF